MSSVYQEFVSTTEQASEKPFLHIPARAAAHYSDGPIDLTYGRALTLIDQLSDQYQDKSYGGPVRIAIALENRQEFFLHWLALNRLGCSVLPISGDLQPAEIAWFLEHGEAALLVTLPELENCMLQACELMTSPPPVISSADLNSLPTLKIADEIIPQHSTTFDAATECALLYTSGSTGAPKGCMLSNEYFTSFGQWYRDLDGAAEIRWGQERLLTPLPLGHMNAMAVSTTGMIMNAGCIIQLDRFHPSTWWQSVRESGATILHYLGVLPAILLELPPGDDDFGEQIRFGFGAGVNPKHHRPFEQRFGFPLIESWAMTECGAGGCITANNEPRHVGTACFGMPTSKVDYELVDERSVPVKPGQDGELRVRATGENTAKGFFSGYLKDSAATAEVWQDGWLNTGDVVREGTDGSLYFVDRRKNVIRRSGENISALEVESTLTTDVDVAEALVTAVPDELRGDEVTACIVPAAGVVPDAHLASRIVENCLKSLAYYKVPGYIVFCETLPKTASNKPRRGEVKDLARSRVAAGECLDTRYLKKRKRSE